VAIDEAHKNM